MPDPMPELILALAVVLAVLGVVLLARVVRARLAATHKAAVAQGWTVTKLPWGGRVYRDPRLDRLAAHHAIPAAGVRSVHCGPQAR